MAGSVSVAVACPQEMVRAGIRSMLEKAGVEIVAEVGTASQLRTVIARRKPRVLLVDGALPGCVRDDGFGLIGELRERLAGTSVVFFTAVENPTYAARARAVGAVNCLSPGFTRDELVAAVRQASQKEPAATTGAFAAISLALTTAPAATSERRLTPREQQVLSHLAYGLSNDEIAASLGIGVETVKVYVQQILRKLGVRDRTQAAVLAVRERLS